MNEEMLAEIRDFIAPIIEMEASQILPDAAFREGLDVDSMKVLEIIVALEERYSVVFKPEHLAEMTTLTRTVALVQRLQNES